MSDQDDLNPTVKLAQAKPREDSLGVIQGGKGKTRLRVVPTPVVAPKPVVIPKPVVAPKPVVIPNPLAIFFQLVHSELMVTTQPAGSVRADKEARENSIRRTEQNKVPQTGVKPEPVPPSQIKPIPQAPSSNLPPKKTETPITKKPTPVETPQPIPDFDPDKILEEIERNEKDRKRRELASDRKREREQKEKEKKAAEERRKERKKFDRSMQNIKLDGKASKSSIDREFAIKKKCSDLRNAAMENFPNDVVGNSDELRELINNWEKRRKKLDEIFEKKDKALKEWKEKNPNTPDHVWLNSQGKKYEKSAIDLLNYWIKEDKQAQEDRSKRPTTPETAQQRNDRIKKEQSNQSSEPDHGILRPNNTNSTNQTPVNPSPAPQNQRSSGRKTIRDQAAKKIKQEFGKRKAGGERPSESDIADYESPALELSLDKLIEKGVNLDTVIKLTQQGLSPNKLGIYLDGITKFQATEVNRRGNFVSPSLREIADLFSVLLGQMNKRFQDNPSLNVNDKTDTTPAKRTMDIIAESISRRDVYEFTKILIKSGRLENPEMLEAILRNFRTQDKESAAKGNWQSLKFAAKLVQSGIDIALEKGADVLDKTRKIAWQVKNVDGDSSIRKSLDGAVDQLAGRNNEVPPSGYKKGIYIEITNPNNPDYNKTPQQLEDLIQKTLRGNKHGDALKAVDQVQITIGGKTLIFDVKNMTVKYNKTYPANQYRISDGNVESNTLSANANTSQKTLTFQGALRKYQDAGNNNDDSLNPVLSSSFTNTFKILGIQRDIFKLEQSKQDWQNNPEGLSSKNISSQDLQTAQVNKNRGIDRGGM
jgi:hypothetical protein